MTRASRQRGTVYPITNGQLSSRTPHSWWQGRELTVRPFRRVAGQIGGVEVRVKPSLNSMFDAPRRGGLHAPVVAVDGRLFSRDVVPGQQKLRAALAAGEAAP